jgi:DNA-binding MarR family transcriptional regulator
MVALAELARTAKVTRGAVTAFIQKAESMGIITAEREGRGNYRRNMAIGT